MMRRKLELDEPETSRPWSASFKENIFDYTHPDKKQGKIAKKCYADWFASCNKKPTVVAHNDQLQDNMMFGSQNSLSGATDFGDVTIGVPGQEFQQLYRVGEEPLEVAVQEECEMLSGECLDLKATKTWTITRELSDCSKRIAINKTDHPKFRNAYKYFNIWLSEVVEENKKVI